MIWIIFAAMTLASVGLLLVPLLRAKPQAASRAAYDLTVYKDQLTEVEREVERGTLSGDQADAARTEIQRRILSVADKSKDKAAPQRKTLATALVIAVVPLLGFGLYLLLGRPDLPDQPYSARAGKIHEMQDQVAMVRNMVDSLAARLEKQPGDARGWALLGRSLRVLGETEQAKDAYRKSAALNPGDAQVRLEYASLILAELPEGALLPPDFVQIMREVVAVDPKNGDALYFLGVSEAQTGNAVKARDYWTRLLAVLPEGSEDRAAIQRQIDELK
jgi:cytochrome c-type biogenesis protein CcmH